MNNEEKVLKLIEDSLNKKCNGLECKAVKNNIDLRLENIQLKKQVDLMADKLIGEVFELDEHTEIVLSDKEHVKQYFERKSKE